MRVVIAPDSFKGTATAAQVADAVASGWHVVRPSDEVRTVPMADGGEGSLDAFASAYPVAIRHSIVVSGPLEDDVESEWLELPGRVGVVELALSSGITMLDELDAAHTHTLGLGQSIRAVLKAGMRQVIVCIGGSASSDGGAGMLVGLGARLLDAEGQPVPLGAAGLDRLAMVETGDLVALPPGGVRVVTDVDAPLLGPGGAIRTFGPQKGVAEADFDRYEERLRWLSRLLGMDPSTPGAGAAGGTGAGLIAWGAVLHPGAEEVAERLGLDARIGDADVVITGEGQYDDQSAAGKVPAYVASRAERHGARSALVAGSIVASTSGFDAAASLVEIAGDELAPRRETLYWLREAGKSLASQIGNEDPQAGAGARA